MSCDLIESQRVTFVAHCRMINVIFPPSWSKEAEWEKYRHWGDVVGEGINKDVIYGLLSVVDVECL